MNIYLFNNLYINYYFFFFFQAEDGIRDIGVTGVQTCALPILFLVSFAALAQSDRLLANRRLRQMAKSTLPRSSPTSFTVSSVPFMALIQFRWCVCQVAHHGLLSLCSMWLCRLSSTVSWRESPLSTVSSWLPGRKWAVHVCLSCPLGSRFCCMGLCACFWARTVPFRYLALRPLC